MVAFGNAVVTDIECATHGDKVRFEFAIIVDHNEAAEADFQQEGFHEQGGQSFGGGVGQVFADDETGEVTHGD